MYNTEYKGKKIIFYYLFKILKDQLLHQATHVPWLGISRFWTSLLGDNITKLKNENTFLIGVACKHLFTRRP